MKNTILLFICLLSVQLSQSQTTNYNNGDVVDDFTVTDSDGVEHNLYSITAQGKYVFLEFFFPSSGQAQTQTPIFNEFYDKYGCNTGDTFSLLIGISANDAEVDQFQNQFGGSFNKAPVVSNDGGSGPVTDNFGINGFPEFILIGPDNVLINNDIFPINNVTVFENAIPNGVTITPMPCPPLGISDLQASSFTIFPTVSNGNQVFLVLNETSKSTIAIYNMLGQEVYNKNFNQQNIELNLSLNSGTYLVKVKTENGVSTERLIIK